MTDAELKRCADNARVVASPVGPMHAWWDAIFDAEAILAGKPSIVSRAELEEFFEEQHLNKRGSVE